uniref:Uncharacterized protein n=1 Tax=viral metagenome TaxID=1070528 RepID=A0A6C0IBG3_9ZZZZ
MYLLSNIFLKVYTMVAVAACAGNTALICKTGDKYTINDSNTTITKIKTDYIDKIEIKDNEISLTPSSSNHYFYADEKAHCSETWQDWFCIPNYHNNNKVNKYPFTKTMSVGVCYDYCAKGSNGKYMTIKNKTKCEVYDDEDDLIYNPLAIIAMIGTPFKDNKENLPELTTLKYIGFRGSYLNDLYRVNKNDNFITNAIINNIKGTATITIAADGTQDYQDKLLANIIKGLHQKDKDGNPNNTILRIRKDINDAITKLKGFYIDGKNKEKREIFFNKIKDYVFDIDKLENVYGKDKNSKAKFINIIAYTYNIMYLVFYDTTKNPSEIRTEADIITRIKKLIDFHNIAGIAENTEMKTDLTKMFLYACYNCFNVNYDNFKTYIDNNPYDDILLRIDINKDTNTNKNLNTEFKKAIIEIDKLATGTDKDATYILAYYIKYYDHSILAEYGDNFANLQYIAVVFGMLAGCLLAIFIIYLLFVLNKGHNIVIAFFNFSFLYYKLVTFGILRISCVIYYNLLSRLSKYTILSILFKIFNIGFIIFLLGYLYKIITDLLGIDYITLLKKTKYDKLSELSPEDRAIYTDIGLYIFITYLIYIYIYSVYIIRYSLSESKFDIMTNIDADDKTALEFVENVLVSNYMSDLISIFTSLHSTTNSPS